MDGDDNNNKMGSKWFNGKILRNFYEFIENSTLYTFLLSHNEFILYPKDQKNILFIMEDFITKFSPIMPRFGRDFGFDG